MKYNMRKVLLLLLYILPLAISAQITESRYDYSEAARSITEDCVTRKEKARAIYKWMCANIAYDTSYSIYTADECWDRRRGVCQAYCDLFYQLGACVGLDVRRITGKTRDKETGRLSSRGHMWLFVVTEGENTGILVDPTWGAGSVNGDKFEWKSDDMSWFDVDPYWLLFTHYPDDESYQLIPRKITLQQFLKLPYLWPFLEAYGLNGKEIFERALEGKTDLPDFYDEGTADLLLREIPLTGELRIGSKYRFVIEKRNDKKAALINGNNFSDLNEWDRKGNNYATEYIPHSPGTVSLGINGEGNSFHIVLEYRVAEPSRADWERLSKEKPFDAPEISRLKNMNRDLCEVYGVDGQRLLEAVRREKVTALPRFYRVPDADCILIDFPFQEVLKVGESYRIRLKTSKAIGLAVQNVDTWYKEWTEEEKDVYSIVVTPLKKGLLSVNLKYDEPNYYRLLEYRVN